MENSLAAVTANVKVLMRELAKVQSKTAICDPLFEFDDEQQSLNRVDEHVTESRVLGHLQNLLGEGKKNEEPRSILTDLRAMLQSVGPLDPPQFEFVMNVLNGIVRRDEPPKENEQIYSDWAAGRTEFLKLLGLITKLGTVFHKDDPERSSGDHYKAKLQRLAAKIYEILFANGPSVRCSDGRTGNCPFDAKGTRLINCQYGALILMPVYHEWQVCSKSCP